MAAWQEDYITLEKRKYILLDKNYQIKCEKITFRSKQMTHSADWKVSTGAEGSVSSGADGAVSLLLSSSSDGALAAPFIEPAIIQFMVQSRNGTIRNLHRSRYQ